MVVENTLEALLNRLTTLGWAISCGRAYACDGLADGVIQEGWPPVELRRLWELVGASLGARERPKRADLARSRPKVLAAFVDAQNLG